jgi:hypothetical protein
MNPDNDARWCPFRPGVGELETIRKDVAEVRTIQQTIVDKNEQVHCLDRVAHQYQVAGSKALLKVAEVLPTPLQNVGLFSRTQSIPASAAFQRGLERRISRRIPTFSGS